MQQPEMRVRYPVGMKLLASVLLLLFATIFFLTYSAIRLLSEDKRAYTFQAQATEARLAGREFVGTAQRSIEILRSMLGATLASGALAPDAQKTLRVGFDNQSTLFAASLWMASADATSASPLLQISPWLSTGHSAGKSLGSIEVSEQDLAALGDEIPHFTPSLRSKPVAFVNLTRAGGEPWVGVMVADPQSAAGNGGFPIAFGIFRLDNPVRSGGTRTTIAGPDGHVLLDSDLRSLYGKADLSADPLFRFGQESQLAAATREYETAEGKWLGTYDKPGANLLVLSRTSWSEAMASTYALVERFLWLGLMAISSGALFAIFFAKSLTRPILRLYAAAQSVSQGNFEIALKPGSRDELGALTAAFVTMSKKIAELIEASVRKVHLENELAIASTVQQRLLPPKTFTNPRFEIRSHYQSAEECGGDWWGYFEMGDKLCLMIADATGHGLPSALITAAAQSCITTLEKFAGERPELLDSPANLLRYANAAIHGASAGTINMTFFMGVMDFKTRKLVFSSAGHNPPWLVTNGPPGSAAKTQSLIATGTRLGEFKDAVPFEEKTIDVSPADILFLYTDGIMEGTNPEQEMFGKKRVLKIVKDSAGAGPDSIIDELTSEFLAYNGQKPLDDDITLVTVQFR